MAAAAAAIPSLAKLLGGVFGVFNKAHQAAVAKEASALNSAVPPFVQGVQQIFQAVNDGVLDTSTAQAGIDQLTDAYYSAISPIMKKGGPCVFDGPFPNPCNGPCSVGCSYVERVQHLGKQLLAGGKAGSVSIQGLGSHAGFAGAPTLTLTLTQRAVTPHQPLPSSLPPTSTVNPDGTIAQQQLASVATIDLFGMQIPRSTAMLLGVGIGGVLILSLLFSGGASDQQRIVVVPAAGVAQ